MNRLRLAGAVAIACALALGWLLWRSAAGDPWQEPADGAVAAGDVGNAAAPPAAVEGGEAGPPERAAVAPPARPPLPALDVPLRLVVDDLRRRADSGDAAAACRLAAEFERCRWLAAEANTFAPTDMLLENMLMQASTEGQAASVEPLVADRDRAKVAAAEAFEHCEGVAEPTASERVRHWRRAALGGHVPAMRHYAIGNAFRFDDLMEAVPELAVYRREAEQVALRAAAAGDAAAIHALAMAYLPGGSGEDWMDSGFRPFLAQVIQPDPGKALAWLYALQLYPGVDSLPEDHPLRLLPAREVPQLAARLPPAQVAAARSAAADHARGWPAELRAPARLVVYSNGGIGDVMREECEPGIRALLPEAMAP